MKKRGTSLHTEVGGGDKTVPEFQEPANPHMFHIDICYFGNICQSAPSRSVYPPEFPSSTVPLICIYQDQDLEFLQLGLSKDEINKMLILVG